MCKKACLSLLPFFIYLLLPATAIAEKDNIKSEKHITYVSGGEVDVYFEFQASPQTKQKLLKWLKVSSETVTTLYGQFPVKLVEVHLYDLPTANEPVPWGEVWKNGKYRVNFQVNANFPLASFISDWTASHEFSHLIHPYTGTGSAWFGEGLATYLQNTLRVRQGSLNEMDMWRKLLDGFRRGEHQAQQNRLTLFQASKNMRSTGNYQHVYWGGAAYFLAVDIRLREITKGRESLDTAWHKFQQCCLSENNSWSVETLISKLDQLTETSVFSEEYKNNLFSKNFPDYYNSFKQLGIKVSSNALTLEANNGSMSQLRRQIIK